MEMVNYIYSILKAQLMVVFSWGFNSPKPLTNGLQFKVQGFKHKGYVTVVYNKGADLFDVALYTSKFELLKKIEDVYLDQLVELIDEEVEKTDDYENRVKTEYSLK